MRLDAADRVLDYLLDNRQPRRDETDHTGVHAPSNTLLDKRNGHSTVRVPTE